MSGGARLVRAFQGAAAAAAISAIIVAAFLFVMFGFDPDALAVAIRALRYTVPAALLIGLPLYLLLSRRWRGRMLLLFIGAVTGAAWTASVHRGGIDLGLLASAALVGAVSGLLAHPVFTRPDRDPGRTGAE